MASEWTSAKDLLVHISTQNLSGIAPQVAEPKHVTSSTHQLWTQAVLTPPAMRGKITPEYLARELLS